MSHVIASLRSNPEILNINMLRDLVISNGYNKNQTAENDVLSLSSLRGTKQSSALIISGLQNNVIGRSPEFDSGSNPESIIMLCFSLDSASFLAAKGTSSQ